MDSNTKLYVFAKFEIFLIFLFMFFIAISSFVFGVKVGEGKRCGDSGITVEDRDLVEKKAEMLSSQEEMVNSVAVDRGNREESVGGTYGRLKEEFNKLDLKKAGHDGTDTSVDSVAKEDVTAGQRVEGAAEAVNEPPVQEPPSVPTDEYAGKYTIQVGSFDTVKEAEQFAEGFRIRGYNPIINEVKEKGTGKAFKVSLGVFDSVSNAKKYILKEDSLFKGEDYYIRKFD